MTDTAEPQQRFAVLVGRLQERLEQIVEDYLRRAREEAPEWTVERPDLQETHRSGARESILAELSAMRWHAALPETLPVVDAGGARMGAQLGVPLNKLLMLYRLGHAVQWDAWFELVEREEPDPEARRALLVRGSSFFFAYANRLSGLATEEYTRERERNVRGHEQRRMNLVRELLDGADVDPGGLDYDVDREHLGLVLWGAAGADVARTLARTLDRRLLLLRAADETWWAWLGGERPLGVRAPEALARFEPPPDTALAAGTEATGRDGFRRTHAQALKAQRAGLRTNAPSTRYEDVALEALVGLEGPETRDFVTRELGALDGDDERAARLRETLEAYFAAGQNATATGASLSVHEHTVSQRLRAVEELIGRSIVSRRAELETALRLRRYL